VSHLIYLRTKRLGGYPFGQDDLDEQTWIDLGILELHYQRQQLELYYQSHLRLF
jgi:hypothetical protein